MMYSKRVQLALVLFAALALSSAGLAHGAEEVEEYPEYDPLLYCYDYVQLMDDWAAYGLSFEIIKSALNASAKADKEGKAAKLLSNKHNLTLLAPTDDAMAIIVADLGFTAEDLADGNKVAKMVDTLIVPLVVIEDYASTSLESMVEDLTKYNVTLVTEFSVTNDFYDYNYTYDPDYDLNITGYDSSDYLVEYNYTTGYEYTYTEYNGTYEEYDPADYNMTTEYIDLEAYTEYNLTYGEYEDYNMTDTGDYDYGTASMPLFQTTCSNGYVIPLSAADVVLGTE